MKQYDTIYERYIYPKGTIMNFDHLDKEEYKNIPLYRMIDNDHGDLPFFIKRYTMEVPANPIHRHEYMQINYVCRGKGKHFVNNNKFEIVKGDIFVLPPYIPHQIMRMPGETLTLYEFEFVPEFINQNFDDMDNTTAFLDFAYIEPFLVSETNIKPRLNLTGETQMETEDILGEALHEYTEKNPGFILLVKALLLKLLVIVGREFSNSLTDPDSQHEYSRHREAITGAMRYISDNHMNDLNADEVAKKFALSLSYFRYLFKSITSKTFTEYLNSMRILKAMELLKTTDKRVLDISLETGFNNVNHFNKVFRQQTGITPLSYRRKG
jgi:AraC-like DNA-binding protein/mannose-6-phosphate isomerase-like protein (cupin superfamily)